MGADTSAQTRLLGHACLFHPTNRRNNRSTPHRKAVPPPPQPAGGAKKTAHVQINPKSAPARTYPHRHVCLSPRQAAEQPRHTLPPKRFPFSRNRQAVQRKRHTPKATPTEHPLERIPTDTSAQTRLLIPPHRQPAEQPKHIPAEMAVFPLSHNRQAVQRKRRTPKATPRAHPLERIPTDTSAQARLHRHACLFHPTGNRQNNQSTFHRGNGGVPPFPQAAGGTKETAHTQSNPNERTHSNVSSQTRLHRHACLFHPTGNRQNNQSTFPRKWRCSPFPTTGRRCKENGAHPKQPQRAHPPERIPTGTSVQTRLHRHACMVTPAYPTSQAAGQPRHAPHESGSPFPTTGRRCKENGARPNQPQRAHPPERIITDTSAQARPYKRHLRPPDEPKQSNIQSSCRLLSESRPFPYFFENLIDFSCST